MKIIIKNIALNNVVTDVLIENNKFVAIGGFDACNVDADKTIDGTDMALLPAFYNLHCHAAMCLLRGFCEDKPLMPWLQEIWKKEATLTGEDIYNGTRLAILEMIKSGTVFFADMYWFEKDILRAVEDMNIRCNIGVTFMDSLGENVIKNKLALLDDYAGYGNDLIDFSPAPHAIYTCSADLYRRCYENAKKNNLYLQTHLAETITETQDCKKSHNGLTPTEYLDGLGVLDSKTIASHCVHLTENDAKILADKQVTVVHNPCSNMKLSSGVFDYPLAKQFGMKIALGTDGCSSNNNLSMLDEMKTVALLSKVTFGSEQSMTADEVFQSATQGGAKFCGLNAGQIREGMDADCILVNMNNERLTPSWNLVHDMVYSADSSCIDTVICNGKILMEKHHVPNEEEIVAKAKQFLKKCSCILLLCMTLLFADSVFAQFSQDYWVRVDGGSFVMGCNQGDEECYPDEQPAHKVSLSSFMIAKYEVTVKEYKEYCQKTGKPMPEEPKYGWHDNYPIVNLTWQDAFDYATYYGCRLPSEAEWEFAAKGGNKSKGYIFSGSNDWNEVGWSFENSDKEPHAVGQKAPNELGIYDMSGNAWEWCGDNYEIFYYEQSPSANPKGPQKGLGKVNRGGCFAFDKELMRVHHRRCLDANAKGTGTGLRLAKDIKTKQTAKY